MIKSRKKQHGFTLIELLIVLACIGILTASAIGIYIHQTKQRVVQQKLELAINELKTATNTCLLIDGHSLQEDCSYNSKHENSSPLSTNQYIDPIPTSLTAVIQLTNDHSNDENSDTATITVSPCHIQSNSNTQAIIQRICANGNLDNGSCELTFHVQPMGLNNAQNSQDAVMTNFSNQLTQTEKIPTQ